MLSKRLDNLHPYVPGEQPKDRDYIKLNANENPYPPSEAVEEAVKALVSKKRMSLALYPDPASEKLRDAIASMINCTGGVLCRALKKDGDEFACEPCESDKLPFEVTRDMVFCGNGSDEVLSLVFYTFFDSDRPLISPEHSYSFYPVYAGYYGIPLKKIPLNADWTLDKKAMLENALETDSPIIFANPNAPTGRALTRDEIRKMLESAPKDRAFIVDEAYVDFGGESAISLLGEFKNLVIVRTFSKSMSLAGLRIGYVIANPEVIRAIETVKNSFNHFPIDVIAQTAGIAACRSCAYSAKNARAIADERDSFSAWLENHDWTVIPSSTNFVFAKKDGKSGESLYRAIKEKGLLVRHFATAGIDDYLRITIGTSEQMNALKTAMETL